MNFDPCVFVRYDILMLQAFKHADLFDHFSKPLEAVANGNNF